MMRLFFVITLVLQMAAPASAQTVVFAAASLKAPLDDVVDAYAQQTGKKIVVSYAATSTMARQIEQGAPADLFLAAHPVWVDHLLARVEVIGERQVFLSNGLVLAGRNGAGLIDLDPELLAQTLGDGRISLPLYASVPLGMYGKQALTQLNLWPVVSDQLAQTDNALTARALLQRGEVPLALLYASDTFGAKDIATVATIPSSAHDPIAYTSVALSETAVGLQDFLRTDAALQIFLSYGFTAP